MKAVWRSVPLRSISTIGRLSRFGKVLAYMFSRRPRLD